MERQAVRKMAVHLLYSELQEGEADVCSSERN